jgi:hypothetical protein
VSTDRLQQAQTIEQQVTQLQTYVTAREGGRCANSTSFAVTAAAAPSRIVIRIPVKSSEQSYGCRGQCPGHRGDTSASNLVAGRLPI